jgi:hypothetical protein
MFDVRFINIFSIICNLIFTYYIMASLQFNFDDDFGSDDKKTEEELAEESNKLQATIAKMKKVEAHAAKKIREETHSENIKKRKNIPMAEAVVVAEQVKDTQVPEPDDKQSQAKKSSGATKTNKGGRRKSKRKRKRKTKRKKRKTKKRRRKRKRKTKRKRRR